MEYLMKNNPHLNLFNILNKISKTSNNKVAKDMSLSEKMLQILFQKETIIHVIKIQYFYLMVQVHL